MVIYAPSYRNVRNKINNNVSFWWLFVNKRNFFFLVWHVQERTTLDTDLTLLPVFFSWQGNVEGVILIYELYAITTLCSSNKNPL